jgi:hypothetical protein
MMKTIFILIFLAGFLPGIESLKSQELTVRDEINSINSLLKANPYRDTFLEITFYYSIDITSQKELVVKMDFDGPFKTNVKVKISDLNLSLQVDTALEGTSSICWYCNPGGISGEANCVYNESTTSQGEKESHYTDNICVMISRESEIRNSLIKEFDKLFQLVLEQ